ncbi:MAG: hypothetical protein CL775_01715 [Chloroflexi bacterium]|nr:hypothetical protein [Chloroflexota bacterium]|tara:strand:- start:1184 stop:1570 length:387 start_codon:yes stop_codon:yes gene_type:complete
MSINSFPVGHKFNTYKLSIDENTSNLFTKAILNRTNDFHSPFAIISVALGMLLEEVELENGAIHINQSVSWIEKFDEKETIFANAMVVSKSERKNNVFIKIKIDYLCDSRKIAESVSTILINGSNREN